MLLHLEGRVTMAMSAGEPAFNAPALLFMALAASEVMDLMSLSDSCSRGACWCSMRAALSSSQMLREWLELSPSVAMDRVLSISSMGKRPQPSSLLDLGQWAILCPCLAR